MARPREFDEDAVLDAAIRCFWSQGYEATSVRDLAGSMGLTGASLYNAFGDKRSLFRRALERYLDQGIRKLIARWEQEPSPTAAIRGVLAELITRSVEDTERRGCFLINSALEVAPHDPEFARMIDGAMGETESFYRRCIERGQRDGSIDAGQTPENLARLLLGIQIGIRVMARTRPDRAVLEGMVAPLDRIFR